MRPPGLPSPPHSPFQEAQQLLALEHYAEAVDALSRALETPLEPLQRMQVHVQLAEILTRLGQMRQSVRHAHEALALGLSLDAPQWDVRALVGLSFAYARLLMGRDALDNALQALRRARRLMPALQGDLVGWAYHRLGAGYCSMEMYDQARDATRQAALHAQPGSDLAFLSLNNLAHYHLLHHELLLRDPSAEFEETRRSHAQSAHTLAQQALAAAMAQTHNHLYHRALALANLAASHLACEAFEAMSEVLVQGFELTQRQRFETLEMEMILLDAKRLIQIGEQAAAIARLNEFVRDEARMQRAPPIHHRALMLLYSLHKRAGQPDSALLALEGTVTLQQRMMQEATAVQVEVAEIRARVEQQVEAMHASARHRVAQLESEQNALRRQADALVRAAHEDALTGLHNRRHSDSRLPLLCELAHREHQSMAVALIDIDHFKLINDQHGHQVGDRVLQHMGRLLRELWEKRQEEPHLIARIGGEEFVMAFIGMTPEQAWSRCEDLRSSVAAHAWSQLVPSLRVRISIGLVHACSETAQEAQRLIEVADRALYRAKRDGRDRVRAQALTLETAGTTSHAWLSPSATP